MQSGILRINDSGQLLGFAYDGSTFAPYLQSGATRTFIGTLNGNDLNNEGQIVGQTVSGGLRAYVWSSATGVVLLGASSTFDATAINNSGQVACQDGFVQSDALCSATTPSFFLGLGISSYTESAINDSGWIVGYSGNAGYLYVPGEGITFFSDFAPMALNNDGQVVGTRPTGPAVWTQGGGFQNLSQVGLLGTIRVTAINDQGEIVGVASSLIPEPATAVPVALTLALLLRRANRAKQTERSRTRNTLSRCAGNWHPLRHDSDTPLGWQNAPGPSGHSQE